MALFKFRKGSDDAPAAAPKTETVEGLRRRARHRLVGAVVLVLAGVIGFPILFDRQPRPISVDIPIDIPDKARAKPLTLPITGLPSDNAAAGTPDVTASAAPVAVAPAAPVTPAASPAAAMITEEKAHAAPIKEAPKVIAKVDAKPEPKPEPKPEAKPVERPVAKADDAAKAQALLEGKAADKKDHKDPAAEGRFIVQVGAFADAAKVREVRQKVERIGLKTYTQEVEAKDGPRTRVRIGPFEGRAEAEKAAAKIKKLDLPAAILTL